MKKHIIRVAAVGTIAVGALLFGSTAANAGGLLYVFGPYSSQAKCSSAVTSAKSSGYKLYQACYKTTQGYNFTATK